MIHYYHINTREVYQPPVAYEDVIYFRIQNDIYNIIIKEAFELRDKLPNMHIRYTQRGLLDIDSDTLRVLCYEDIISVIHNHGIIPTMIIGYESFTSLKNLLEI